MFFLKSGNFKIVGFFNSFLRVVNAFSHSVVQTNVADFFFFFFFKGAFKDAAFSAKLAMDQIYDARGM